MDVINTVEKNKEVIRTLYEKILNTRKLDMLSEIVSEDYTGVRGEKGTSGLAQSVIPVIKAFPDVEWVIEDLIAEGDKVVVRWTWKGTNTSSFNEIPPTNKTVTTNAVGIYEIKDGKIIKSWMLNDRLGFLKQLGVVPQDLLQPAATVK